MMTGWRKRAMTQGLCGMALVIGLTACSSSNGYEPASGDASTASVGIPVVTAVPRLVASLNLRLPLDDYLPSVDELQRYGLANRALISQCMLRFGIDVTLPTPASGVGPRTWTERRYGLTDATQAALLGYGLGNRDPGAHSSNTTEPDLSPRALAILTGDGSLPKGHAVPSGGCSGEAQRALAGHEPGDAPVDEYLAQRLSQESFERSRRDPRVLDVFARWSRCMRGDGHDYTNPLAPFSDPSLQRGAHATQKGISTAVDDVACKRRTNLVGIWYAVESAYQRGLVDDNQAALDALAEVNRLRSDAVARALDGTNDAP